MISGDAPARSTERCRPGSLGFMPITPLAEQYLAAFADGGRESPGGISYLEALQQCRLDYTPDSLGRIDTLLNVTIILSCFVFSIVIVMLGYCVWKYRVKPGDESDGEPIHGNTRLEIAWTVIPTVIVLFGAIYSWIVLGDIESQASDALHIDVTAQQYEWTFNYPQPDGKVVSSKTLVVPDNRQLSLHLTALDVLHSFWVPEWRIKRDLVPAGPGGNDVDNTVVVTPDKVGTYNVVCTELCGFGHSTMRALVRVVPTAQYETWLKRQPEVTPSPGSPNGSSTGTSSQESADGGTTTTTPSTTTPAAPGSSSDTTTGSS